MASYFRIKRHLHDTPKITKKYSVSAIIPAYNEEDAIEETIRSVVGLNYENLKEIIVVNDGSSDNTINILKKLKKEFSNLKILDKKNSGKADSINQAIKIAKGELIAIIDSDSFPRSDALKKTVGYFDDPKVGVVTIPVLVRSKHNLLSRLQRIEYAVIALTRKLLEPIDGIYVTPGPFALYRGDLIRKRGFDTKNLTEDIELTWHLASKNYSRKMNLTTNVTTIAPDKLRVWWKQRNRWALGGFQTFWKYRKNLFRENVLGYFIAPFFGIGIVMGLVGMIIWTYLLVSRFINQYLLVKFSLVANTAIISSEQLLNFSPTVLNFFGIVLFFFMFLFTIFNLTIIDIELYKGKRFIDLLLYMTLYLILAPFILVTATFKLIKGDMRW